MSELSNHSQQTNDGCAQRTQRRILNTDGNVMAKLCAPNTISVYGVTVEPLLYDHPQNHIGVVV